MAEIERTGIREREPSGQSNYEKSFKAWMALRERAFKGQIVIRGEDLPWESARQGILKFYLSRDSNPTDSANGLWEVLVHDIHTHSGEHRHQGGLVLYILEGEGYTEVDGVRVDWEAGDLLLLPLKKDGVVHKHYNKLQGMTSKWIAFIYRPLMDEVGMYIEQKQTAPTFK